MKTEEAIKVLKLFKECNEQLQPKIVFESIDYAISALESIDRITAERDAAIADLRKLSVRPSYFQCDCCLHFQKADGIKRCRKKPDFSGKCWEWRGVQR